jgi:hypothetical protein
VLPKQGKPQFPPSAAARFLLKPDQGLFEEEKMGVPPAAGLQFLLEQNEGLPEQEKT